MSDDALQAANSAFGALQQEMSAIVDARQRLEAQKAENDSVKKEFTGLQSHNTVYKLIGSVLVKQDQAEARSTVDKRLEFITSEIKRVEGQLKDLSQKAEALKVEIAQLQSQRPPQDQSQQPQIAAA